MIPFGGLSQFSGHFGGDRPSPLNRDTTVMLAKELITSESSGCKPSCFVSLTLRMVGSNFLTKVLNFVEMCSKHGIFSARFAQISGKLLKIIEFRNPSYYYHYWFTEFGPTKWRVLFFQKC